MPKMDHPRHTTAALPVSALWPNAHDAKTRSKQQLHQIAESAWGCGFTDVVLVDAAGQVVAGHGRLQAAKLLGLADLPTIKVMLR